MDLETPKSKKFNGQNGDIKAKSQKTADRPDPAKYKRRKLQLAKIRAKSSSRDDGAGWSEKKNKKPFRW